MFGFNPLATTIATACDNTRAPYPLSADPTIADAQGHCLQHKKIEKMFVPHTKKKKEKKTRPDQALSLFYNRSVK